MLSIIQRKLHVKKKFGYLSRGQKGQNPPHSSDLEKNQKFQKNFFFSISILMISILTDVTFHFMRFCFPYLCALQLYGLIQNVGTKIFDFVFDFNFDVDFLLNPCFSRLGFYEFAVVCPSVCPSVLPEFFSELDHQFFLIFCMNLGDHRR